MTVTMLDLTAEGPPPDVVADRYETDGGRIRIRDPATVDGIVVHQTACTFGPSDDAHKRHRRALRIPAHATAFRDGTFVLPCDVRAYACHGNRLNARSLGLEIEGRYPGCEDDPATAPREDLNTIWGGEADAVTDLVVETARAALDELLARGIAAGMPLRFVWAHRQSSATRRADPGSELWRRVVLEHAVAVRGLIADRAHTIGSGRPVPKAWDPAGSGKY